ncbi:hypothetical protein HPB48_017109 [Haemaphysalis longicornis]|uniref:Uncharacterized protein n=1 Tax=Haemaphysalis longicornis TaxID=44386 RepID=A0A9J6GSR2_HAELO|nr:hypothetical protein HPB48_017109 [Haemaphysalis longicornis]
MIFILTGTLHMIHDVQVIGRIKTSDHRMFRSRISLDLRRERLKMQRRKTRNMPSVERKMDEFRLLLENKFSVLSNDTNDADSLNSRFTYAVMESALAIGEKQPAFESKLSEKTKELIDQRR